MLKTYKYYIVLIFAIIIGAGIIQSLLQDYSNSLKTKNSNELLKFHSDAVIRAKAGIDVYSVLVSSIRSHIENVKVFPNETEFQGFLNDLLRDLNFKDSIVVDYINTNHEFKFVVSPTELDAPGLVGLNVKDLRTEEEIQELNKLMETDKIRLYAPINLREGWTGFPFNFRVKNSENEVVGYFSSILNVKYLLEYFYNGLNSEHFMHSFVVNDSIDITREVIYDNTEIFNTSRDDSYYKNFNVAEEHFIYSDLDRSEEHTSELQSRPHLVYLLSFPTRRSSDLNVKYLLEYFYNGLNSEHFMHSFVVNDSIDITREVIYDNTEIFNTSRDDSYYKNFNVAEEHFIYSDLDVFGLKLTVGSAYKIPPKSPKIVYIVTYIWYGSLSLFSFIVLMQIKKNRSLNNRLILANEEIEEKNNRLKYKLDKINTLIKEIHHRVKNNMQMIANLLTLQEGEYEDPKILAALEQSRNRIQSMALVHEKLYGSTNLQDVNTFEYVNQLIEFIEEIIGNKDILPKKTINISEDIILDSETMSSFGLILNELITNSYKYAFKPNRSNSLEINITPNNGSYILVYSDNGPGLPKDFVLENSDSLGMQLIYILTKQLKSTVSYSNEGKSMFTIEFNNAEAVD